MNIIILEIEDSALTTLGLFLLRNKYIAIYERRVIYVLLFENCSFYYNEDAQSDRPFIVGVKDREHSNDNMERWDMVSLTEDEAKSVYKLLKQYFKD